MAHKMPYSLVLDGKTIFESNYEGMKKVVIAPPLTEIQKVKKANRR